MDISTKFSLFVKLRSTPAPIRTPRANSMTPPRPSHTHQIVWEGKYLRVKVCGTWEYAERPNSPAGIVVIAVTPEGNLLLTEQYRVPMGKNVIELPAGLSGDESYGGE